MKSMKSIADKKEMDNAHVRMVSYRNDIDALLRVWQIRPLSVAKADPNDYRWSQYSGPIHSDDPIPVPDSLLKNAYGVILSRIGDIKSARNTISKMPDGTEKSGGLAKLKELATKAASVLTMHDNPVVHLKGDLYDLEFRNTGNVATYSHYSIKISPSWIRKVARKNLTIQDIAGREAMVLDAEQLPNTPEDYEAYATKVVTIRRPIARKGQVEIAKAWEEEHIPGQGTMITYRDFRHPAFLKYENRYVVRTMTTDGWKSCTGTTVNWAASTLKRRMKAIMLRKLSV